MKSVNDYFSSTEKFPKEQNRLREIVLDCRLIEELKWQQPCYSFNKHNICIIGFLKAGCVLSFFKGALLQDEAKLLTAPGQNTQSARMFTFNSVTEIDKLESTIKAYIFEAMEVEKAGLPMPFKPVEEYPVPEEFQKKLNELPELKKAFEALTPGRRKAYLLHFAEPKQSKTRESRIEKCMFRILDGKGLTDF